MCVRLRLPHLGGGGGGGGGGVGGGSEKHKPRVFDTRVLSKIFGLKWHELREEWRRLHKQELYDLYSTLNTIWVMKSKRWAGHVARMGDRRYIWSFGGVS